MKLASLKTNSSRDGQLCLVDRSLTWVLPVPQICKTMQAALDDWDEMKPRLEAVYKSLNDSPHADALSFTPEKLLSPLPRAFQWADGSAYVNHVELVRKARNAIMPDDFWTNPLMYQGGSDDFLGPYEPITLADEAYGLDFEAEVAVITNDVPMQTVAENASKHIKLIMLVNDVSLRNLIPGELEKGFGFYQSKPSSSFSPVAITPDELGDYWDGERVHFPLLSYLNGTLFGQPNAGVDMTFSFPQLIAHATKTRRLCAGSIIGSGTVSNLDRSLGSSCIAEKRMLEIIESGAPLTPFMKKGDHIRIEMLNDKGQNLFGSISQTVQLLNLNND